MYNWGTRNGYASSMRPTAQCNLQLSATYSPVQPTAQCSLQPSATYSPVQPTAQCSLQPSATYSPVQPTAQCSLQPSAAYSPVQPKTQCSLQLSATYSPVQPTALCSLQPSATYSPVQRSLQPSEAYCSVKPTAQCSLQPSAAYSPVQPTAQCSLQPSATYSSVQPTTQLLSLLLLHILLALAVPHVGCSSPDSNSPIGTYSQHNIISSPPLIKRYLLIPRCTDKAVQMHFQKKIFANGTRKSLYSCLKFISDATGAIKIRSSVVNTYLCFSRKGRLISRKSAENSQCKFREVTHNNYFKLQSVANPKWYMGFDRRGRKLKGYDQKDTWASDKCFMFTKLDWPYNRKRRHQRHLKELKMDTDGMILSPFNLCER